MAAPERRFVKPEGPQSMVAGAEAAHAKEDFGSGIANNDLQGRCGRRERE